MTGNSIVLCLGIYGDQIEKINFVKLIQAIFLQKNILNMKHLTNLLFTAIIAFSISACSKSSDPAPTDPTSGLGSGSFTLDGVTVSGTCIGVASTSCSGGLDVGITPTTGSSEQFSIVNMPSASSGTFNITNATQSSGTCNLWAGTSGYLSKSGTLTKTGAKSFTFTATLYDATEQNPDKTITGQGTYVTP